jgi:transcriptional regulator with XRE-family HTH domain
MELTNSADLPKHVRRQRRLADLTQYELADAIGRQQAWVSAFERGLVRAQPRDLEAFAKVLGVSTRADSA